MDYYQIGQRIRKIRKAHKLSQDELASKVGISTTHMSHIETGNTKLSLPVLVDLADALQVRVDDLLFDSPRDSVSSTGDELQQLLDGCNSQQAKVILDIAKSAKTALEKYYWNQWARVSSTDARAFSIRKQGQAAPAGSY